MSVCLQPQLSGMQSACAILYCHLWPVWLYHIFSTLCHKDTTFEKGVIKHKICVLIFYTNLSGTFLIIRRIQRDIIITVYSYLCKVPVIFIRFQSKMNFFQQIFEKQPNIKFHKNPSSGSQVVPCGRTDRQLNRQTVRHEGANSHLHVQQLCATSKRTNIL